MANRFDSVNYPPNVPDILYVGDNWLWKRDLTDYPRADYTLSYSFRLLSSTATEISLGSSVITESETSLYTIDVPSATTTGYTKGDYTYQEYITNSSSERLVVWRFTLIFSLFSRGTLIFSHHGSTFCSSCSLLLKKTEENFCLK